MQRTTIEQEFFADNAHIIKREKAKIDRATKAQ